MNLRQRVVIGTIKDNDYIEATIYAAGMMYRAEASDKEILAAIDKDRRRYRKTNQKE